MGPNCGTETLHEATTVMKYRFIETMEAVLRASEAGQPVRPEGAHALSGYSDTSGVAGLYAGRLVRQAMAFDMDCYLQVRPHLAAKTR